MYDMNKETDGTADRKKIRLSTYYNNKSPSWMSSEMPVVSILEKIYHFIVAPHCIKWGKNKCTLNLHLTNLKDLTAIGLDSLETDEFYQHRQ